MPRNRYGSLDVNGDEDLQKLAELPQRVIVKFYPPSPNALVASLEAEDPQARLASEFSGYTVVPVVSAVSGAELDRLYREAVEDGAPASVGNLRRFLAIELPRDSDPSAILQRAMGLSGVEYAYLEPSPAPPPVAPADDPRSANQAYLDAAPGGIDARYAWGENGGDGANVGLVDLEQGWVLNHEDLAAQNIGIISGSNALFRDHGTAVLGEMCAVDNDRGDVGITPAASVRVVSQHQPAGFSTAGAIASAALAMNRGDVLLLEAQVTHHGFLHPVEIDNAVFSAIRQAVAQGIVVVEAAANGTPPGMAPGLDLDTATDAAGKFVLNRSHADFQDSGAIMVGAGSSAVPHARLGFSNFGSRIDCYAWGENIDTTDTTAANPTAAYRPDAASGRSGFSGTSGASPIVAGAAVALQGFAKAHGGTPLSPSAVRAALSDPALNTASANPASDRIGVMPDLRAIHVQLFPPVGDFPQPNPDVAYAGCAAPRQPRVCIDPGHGGAANRGSSTALGARGQRRTLEKEVTLRAARSLRRLLGGDALITRDGDYNLSLAERTALARQSGAPVFVSIHASSGDAGQRGSEVWVYGDGQLKAGAESQALAACVSEELALLGHGSKRDVGELAVLHPDYHGVGVAACLVEADYLSHPDGERRLSDAQQLDALAGAVARGVNRYLAASARSRVRAPAQPSNRAAHGA
jgi:N-acetylmuramoyl-L-alanine amidase